MKKLIGIVLLVTSLNVFAPELSQEQKEAKELNKQNDRELDYLLNEAEFSEDNLRRLLELLEVEHIDIVMNQARLESAWFTSRVFKEGNNIFGMHMPRVRDTYAYEYMIADGGRKVASYRSWQSSVMDYITYLRYYENLGYSTKNYYSFLESVGYCEKGIYTNILKSMT
jgi:uncharacterized FlgJ-related protein